MAAHNPEFDLDAYGHLNWTVGNEDWTACFDARRNGDGIEYHVVVNCESGGFVDTLAHAIVPSDPNNYANLCELPSYWADLCREQYGAKAYRSGPYFVSVRETKRCAKAWAEHLASLLNRPCSDTDPCEVCSECCEPGPDPIRDGWIGSDGRP